MNYKQILAKNVKALMAGDDRLNSHAKLAEACSTVSPRAIGYLLKPDSRGLSDGPQLGTIVAIAQAFKVPPWALLRADFDPKRKIPGEPPSDEVMELAKKIAALSDERRELLMDIFGEPVEDGDVESAGFPAPHSAKHAVHEKQAGYKTPKQFRMKLPKRG